MQRTSSTTGITYSTKPLPKSLVMKVKQKNSYRCFYCQVSFVLHPKLFTVDHVVQRYQGGKDELSNLIPACRHCNNARGAMTVTENVEYIAGKIANWRYYANRPDPLEGS